MEGSMKFKSTIFRQLRFFLCLMIISGYELHAQESDSIKSGPKGLFVGLSLGPSQTLISIEGLLSVSELVNHRKIGISGTVEVGYFLSDYIGLSSGMSYNSFNGQVTLNAYQNKFNTYDSENEAYERQVSGTNITEDQKIAILGIPIYLNFRVPFNKRTGLSIRTGIEMAIPVTRNYHSTGTFTYKGYYPKYNVLLEDLPAYGFPSNTAIATDGAPEIKSFWVDVSASAGIDFYITKEVLSSVSVFYTRSLSGIQAYASPEKFQLSTDANQINSMMGGSSNVYIQSAGLQITLHYFLSRH
jgi:hypothetical protein